MKNNKNNSTIKNLTSSLLLFSVVSVVAATPITTTQVSGYVKFDSIYNDENDATGTLREQALLTLNGDEANDEEGDLYLSSYESRINFTSQTKGTPVGDLKAVIEGDFYSGPTQNVVNLRHAYFVQDKLTIGQTWSTFMDLASLAETADFGGPAGRIFTRQSLVRYNQNVAGGKIDLAVEDPKNGVADEQDPSAPDLVAKFTRTIDSGHISAAVLIQNLKYDDGTDSDSTMAFAGRVSGRINIGSDNIKFALISGQAMGGYLNFGDVQAADFIDEKIELSEQTATRISYQHLWSGSFRSTIRYAITTSELDGEDQGDFSSLHANLVYNLYKPVKFGAEIINAEKKQTGEKNLNLSRFHLFAKYNF